MTNLQKVKINITESKEKSFAHSLDTIQVTCYSSFTETRIRQHYKGLRKYATDAKLAKIEPIAKILNYSDTEMYLKRFERVRNCKTIMIQDGDELSKLCESREQSEDRRFQNVAHTIGDK